MLRNFRKFLSPGLFPFLLAILLAVFSLFYNALNLPTSEELLEIGKNYYENYGVITLFIASFIEAIFMVNFYFPGSFVIVLAVLIAPKTFLSFAVIALVVWIGFTGAGILNYYLGNKGFYRALLFLGQSGIITKMQNWLRRRGNLAVFLSAIHPNFLAIAQVSMGIAHRGIFKTISLSALSLAFWVPFWTIIGALIASSINLADPKQDLYIIGFFVLWGLVLVFREYLTKKGRTIIPPLN